MFSSHPASISTINSLWTTHPISKVYHCSAFSVTCIALLVPEVELGQLCAAQQPGQNVLCCVCSTYDNTCRKWTLDKVKKVLLDYLTGCLLNIGYSIVVYYETAQNPAGILFSCITILHFFVSSPRLWPYIAVTDPCKLQTK